MYFPSLDSIPVPFLCIIHPSFGQSPFSPFVAAQPIAHKRAQRSLYQAAGASPDAHMSSLQTSAPVQHASLITAIVEG